MAASSVRDLTRQWNGRLAGFRNHRNDEHLEALLEEALTFAGLHLENDLSSSSYWSKAPLARRVAVLLYLVDQGIVHRTFDGVRTTFTPVEAAELWARAQSALASYLEPTLELLSALSAVQARRTQRPAS